MAEKERTGTHTLIHDDADLRALERRRFEILEQVRGNRSRYNRDEQTQAELRELNAAIARRTMRV